MQGSRGPGLLMGFGKAKLAPLPVRKFAPSLKPQAPKPVVLAVTQELDSVILNHSLIFQETSPNEELHLNAADSVIEQGRCANSSSVSTVVTSSSVSNISHASTVSTSTLNLVDSSAAAASASNRIEPKSTLLGSEQGAVVELSPPLTSKKVILQRPKKTVRININSISNSVLPVSLAESSTAPPLEPSSASSEVSSGREAPSSASSAVKRMKTGQPISAPSSSQAKSKSQFSDGTKQGNDGDDSEDDTGDLYAANSAGSRSKKRQKNNQKGKHCFVSLSFPLLLFPFLHLYLN